MSSSKATSQQKLRDLVSSLELSAEKREFLLSGIAELDDEKCREMHAHVVEMSEKYVAQKDAIAATIDVHVKNATDALNRVKRNVDSAVDKKQGEAGAEDLLNSSQ